MPADHDDHALTWEGDEDRAPAPVRSAAPSRGPALPDGFEAVGKGSDAVGRLHPDGTVTMPGDRTGLSNAMLVTLGVIGGIYLLLAIGWLIAGLRLVPASVYLVATNGVAPPLWQAGMVGALVVAVAAPAIWFVTTLALTRGGRPWVRIVALVVGAVLLVPWPFVSFGALGA